MSLKRSVETRDTFIHNIRYGQLSDFAARRSQAQQQHRGENSGPPQACYSEALPGNEARREQYPRPSDHHPRGALAQGQRFRDDRTSAGSATLAQRRNLLPPPSPSPPPYSDSTRGRNMMHLCKFRLF